MKIFLQSCPSNMADFIVYGFSPSCKFFIQRLNTLLHEPQQIIVVAAFDESTLPAALEVAFQTGDHLAGHHSLRRKMRWHKTTTKIKNRCILQDSNLIVVTDFHFEMKGFVAMGGERSEERRVGKE